MSSPDPAKNGGSRAARDIAAEVAVQAVIAAGAMAAVRGWVPATSGNFSVRVDAKRIAITRSGAEKGAMAPADVIVLPIAEPKQPGASAETPLHAALYAGRRGVGAVWHIHSPNAVVASRLGEADGAITLTGWELQKALAGVTTHEGTVVVPVLANDQDTDRLAAAAMARIEQPAGDAAIAPGFLISGHGLYVWGVSGQDAWRHAEALEMLLAYELELQRMQRSRS